MRAWQEFRTEWSAVLKDPRFDVPYLHMKEYVADSGPFAKWKDEKDIKAKFLSELMDVMDRFVMAVVGATFPISDFKRLTQDQRAVQER